MNDLSREQVAAALHQHLEQAYRALAQAFQSVTWHHELGGSWFFTDHPLPLCNGVLHTECDTMEVNLLIEHIRGQAEARQTPFLWLVGPSTHPADLPQWLEVQGLKYDETVLGMLLDLQALPEDQVPLSRLSISPVETREQMEIWLHTFTTGFGLPEAVTPIFFNLIQTSGFVPHASRQFYLGTSGSTPVATSLLFTDGDMAGIYAVATVPSHRRLGIGTKMTRMAIEEARRLGFTQVTLQATQMGESVYRRLGFLPVCSFQTYIWEPGASISEG